MRFTVLNFQAVVDFYSSSCSLFLGVVCRVKEFPCVNSGPVYTYTYKCDAQYAHSIRK